MSGIGKLSSQASGNNVSQDRSDEGSQLGAVGNASSYPYGSPLSRPPMGFSTENRRVALSAQLSRKPKPFGMTQTQSTFNGSQMNSPTRYGIYPSGFSSNMSSHQMSSSSSGKFHFKPDLVPTNTPPQYSHKKFSYAAKASFLTQQVKRDVSGNPIFRVPAVPSPSSTQRSTPNSNQRSTPGRSLHSPKPTPSSFLDALYKSSADIWGGPSQNRSQPALRKVKPPSLVKPIAMESNSQQYEVPENFFDDDEQIDMETVEEAKVNEDGNDDHVVPDVQLKQTQLEPVCETKSTPIESEIVPIEVTEVIEKLLDDIESFSIVEEMDTGDDSLVVTHTPPVVEWLPDGKSTAERTPEEEELFICSPIVRKVVGDNKSPIRLDNDFLNQLEEALHPHKVSSSIPQPTVNATISMLSPILPELSSNDGAKEQENVNVDVETESVQVVVIHVPEEKMIETQDDQVVPSTPGVEQQLMEESAKEPIVVENEVEVERHEETVAVESSLGIANEEEMVVEAKNQVEVIMQKSTEEEEGKKLEAEPNSGMEISSVDANGSNLALSHDESSVDVEHTDALVMESDGKLSEKTISEKDEAIICSQNVQSVEDGKECEDADVEVAKEVVVVAEEQMIEKTCENQLVPIDVVVEPQETNSDEEEPIICSQNAHKFVDENKSLPIPVVNDFLSQLEEALNQPQQKKSSSIPRRAVNPIVSFSQPIMSRPSPIPVRPDVIDVTKSPFKIPPIPRKRHQDNPQLVVVDKRQPSQRNSSEMDRFEFFADRLGIPGTQADSQSQRSDTGGSQIRNSQRPSTSSAGLNAQLGTPGTDVVVSASQNSQPNAQQMLASPKRNTLALMESLGFKPKGKENSSIVKATRIYPTVEKDAKFHKEMVRLNEEKPVTFSQPVGNVVGSQTQTQPIASTQSTYLFPACVTGDHRTAPIALKYAGERRIGMPRLIPKHRLHPHPYLQEHQQE